MRKEKLKKIVLNNDCYDISIYRLLSSNTLDAIIGKMDNISVPCDVNPENITSAEEQFIGLLNRFVSFFKKKFYNLAPYYDLVIEELITSNVELFSDYLLSKHYLGDNKYTKFFEDSINRLSVANFIKNFSCVNDLRQLLIDNKIKIKEITKYSFKEILKISTIASDITFCSENGFRLMILFTDINNVIQNSNQKKAIKNSMLKDYEFKYQILISEYNNKKRFIEKIKNR